jgi:hypothetical protein
MNIQNLCDSVDDLKKLVLLNNCFSIKMQQTIMAELCCLSKLSLPMDGFQRVSSPIGPHSSLTIFDNELDISPLPDKMQVRGFIMCFGYPSLDANGETLPDTDKNVLVHMFNYQENSFAASACKMFSLLGNPTGSDKTKILNRLVVENTGNFTVNAEGLLLLVNKNGMTLAQGMATCC